MKHDNHVVVKMELNDSIELTEVSAGQFWLRINDPISWGPHLSIDMDENGVARLRDFLKSFRTTNEAKLEAEYFEEHK